LLACLASLSARAIDYSKTRPQNVFATPILNPMPEKTHGEPAITWHDGEYVLVYDFAIDGGPACLMTSTDGVYWREEGAILWPIPGERCIECPDLRQCQPDGPFVLSYDAHPKGTHIRRFAISHDLRHWKKLDHIFRADERYYRDKPFYNQYSIRNPRA
jgi:hypothetical protein